MSTSPVSFNFRRPLAALPKRAPHKRSRCHAINRRRRDARRVEHVWTRAMDDSYEGPQLEKLDLESTGGLGGTSQDLFGPLAILLVGFQETEFHQIRRLLDEMDASMIELIPCPPEGLTATLGELITMTDISYQEGPLGLRRIMFLSGMYASEIQEVISAYHDAPLPETLFAAYVPKNKDKRIIDLIEEVYGDHEYMIAKRNRERQNKDH